MKIMGIVEDIPTGLGQGDLEEASGTFCTSSIGSVKP
jgi:hypothetical protein